MSKWLQFIFLFCFLLTSTAGFGDKKQKKIEKLINDAEIEMLHGNFANAISLLQSAKKINQLYADIYKLQIEIGELSHQANLIIDANQMLIKIFPEEQSYKLVLAKLLVNAGNYEKAQSILSGFKSKTSEYQRLNASCSYALQQLNQPSNTNTTISLLAESVNTEMDEYWPSYSVIDSFLYFTRLVNLNQHFNTERIYYYNENKCESCVEQLQLNQNSNISEGNISITPDGNLLFLTMCGGVNGKGSCDIYYSIKKDSLWAKPQKAPYPVSTQFWESQPFLSYDGTKLYFVSNREGGFGGMDIYQCELRFQGEHIQFENIINIGSPINTEFDEFSPYLTADATCFYFSSNGHIGMGGSDLYKATYSNHKYAKIVNLGFPINTNFDEGGFTAGINLNPIYFHSNKPVDSLNSKNIYKIVKPIGELQNNYVFGKIIDRRTSKTIEAKIEFKMQSKDSIIISNSNKITGYRTTLPKSKTIDVAILKSGYKPYYQRLQSPELLKSTTNKLNFVLDPLSVGESFIVENLLFEFDSAELLPKSNLQLLKLLDFLKANPKIKIEIIGHTDQQGSAEYNQNLSELRAETIYNFLIKEIDGKRLKYSGKGDKEPIEHNYTELGRALNRRTEIKILDLNFSKD